MVNEVLNNHDRQLEQLLQSGSMTTEVPSTDDFERTKKLTAALQKLVVEELCDRLDRIYLCSLTSDVDASSNNEPPAGDLIQQLEEDLESLYSEIQDITSMSISQQHTIPIMNVLNAMEIERQAAANRKAQMVSNSESTAVELTHDSRLKRS